MSPALAGRFSTSGPPGKSCLLLLKHEVEDTNLGDLILQLILPLTLDRSLIPPESFLPYMKIRNSHN